MAKQGQIHFSITGNNSDFLAKIRQNNQAIKDGANITDKASAQMRSAIMGVGAAIGVGFGIDQIRQFGMELINVRGQFQTFEAVLTNTFGDKNKAKESMDMIQDFAATTPFQVDALTGSFVKLVNQGFTPTYKEMTSLGDLASSTGKGFDQLTEAIIDAQTGEFERLKEFGIRASKEGDKVTFNFKEQATQVDFTASSIRDYILSLGELQGVQGSNAAIAATLTGQVSNLEDSITQMMNKIGQSSEGALSGAISSASYLVEHYEEVGKALGVLITMYGSYKAVTLAYVAIQKLAIVAGEVKAFIQLTKAIKSAKDAQLLLNMTTKANPYVLLASVLLSVGAALLIYADNTGRVEKAAQKLNKAIGDETKLLDESYESVKKSTEGSDERKESIEKFNSKYGEYLENLLSEKSSMEDVADAYELAKTKIKEYAVEKARTEYLEEPTIKLAEKESDLISSLGNWSEKLNSRQQGKFQAYVSEIIANIKKGNTADVNSLYDAFRAAQSENTYSSIEEWTDAFRKGNEKYGVSDGEIIDLVGGIDVSGSRMKLESLGWLAKDLETKKKEFESFSAGYSSVLNKGDDGKEEDTTEPTYGVQYEAAKKNWEDAKKVYDDIQKDKNAYSEKAYNDAKNNLETTRKAFAELGGETQKSSPKQANNNPLNPITEDDKVLIANSIDWYEEQIRQLQETRGSLTDKGDIAEVDTKIKGHQKSIDVLNGVDEESREKAKQEERLKNFQTFASRYEDIDKKHKENLELIEKKGGTNADVNAENQDYEDKLKSLNDEVLATIGEFESLGVDATDKVIDDMIQRLLTAKTELENDASGADNAAKIAAVNAELERLKKLKEENDKPSTGRSLKEWQDMESQLKDCVSSFNEIGDAVGGVAGEIISTAGSIAGSTISMVSSIAQLVDISINGTKAAAEGASKAIRAVETASVILAVISAVIQVATKIASLFGGNKKAEEDHQNALREITERNIDAQTRYNALLREEVALQAERNTIFGDDPYSGAIGNTTRYAGAMKDLKDAIKGSITEEERHNAMVADLKTMGGAKATQKLMESYRSGTKGLNDIKIVTGSHTEKKWFLGKKHQVDDYSSIMEVEEFKDLVDEYGNLNIKRAQTAIDTQKMSEEDKKRLEGMITLQEEADEAIKSVNQYYSDIFGDMGASLKDSLVDAFRNGTDAGEEFCKNMVGMLEKLGEDFAYSMSIGQVMAEQKEKIDAINKNNTLTEQERAEKLMALAIETGEKAAAQQDDFNKFLEAYQQGASKEGYDLWQKNSDSERQSTAKGIATASQDSVVENNAIGRTQLGFMSSIHNGVHNFIIPDLAKVRESFTLMQVNLVDQLVELRGIRKNTDSLPQMGKDISTMNKGIKKLVTAAENL